MDVYNITAHIRYSIYRECPKTNWAIGTRTIPDHEFVLITGGDGEVTIEGKTYSARQGMLFYFYPGLIHSLKSSNSNPMRFYAVHFVFAHVNYVNNQWSVQPCSQPLPIQPAAEVRAYRKLQALLEDLNQHWKSRAPGYETLCNSILMQLYYYILQDMRGTQVNYASRGKVEKIAEYIKQNLDKELSVRQLAEMANLSVDYLTCLFKKYTGYSPVKYINKCRIDAAKAQLAGEPKKIREIALQLGFKDEFYFSRVFKQFEGISPHQFYRNLLNNTSPK